MIRKLFLFTLLVVVSSCKTEEVASTFSNQSKLEYHEGLRCYLSGDLNNAMTHLRKSLSLAPKMDAAHYLISKIELIEGHLAESAAALTQANACDPGNVHYVTEMAYMYGEMNQFDKAGLAFETLTKQYPNDASYYVGAYENYLQAKKYIDAIRITQKQERSLGATSSQYFNRYKLYLLLKQEKDAVATLVSGNELFPGEPLFLSNLIDRYIEIGALDKARPLLDRLCVEDPKNGMAKIVLGDVLISQGQTVEGEKRLKEAIGLYGPTVDQKARIVLQFQKRDGCTKDNISLALTLTELHGEEALAHSILGDTYILCEENKEAVKAYGKAVQISPNSFPIWQHLTFLEFQEGQWRQLTIDAKKCLDLFPAQPYSYLIRGISLNKEKTYGLAQEILDQGLALIVNQPILESEIHFQLGVTNIGYGNYSQSMNSFKRSLSMQDKNLDIKADCALELGLMPEGLAQADSLIDLCLKAEPENGRYLSIKGRLLMQRNDLDQAIKFIELGLSKGAVVREATEWLGDCYNAKGDRNKAVVQWKISIEKGNENAELIKKIKTP